MSDAEIPCEQLLGRQVEYPLAHNLNLFEELPGSQHAMWSTVVDDILAHPEEYNVTRGCRCERSHMTVIDPDRCATHVRRVLEIRIPDVAWNRHSAPAIVAARLLATSHGLGGAVVAYDASARNTGTVRVTWHWANHGRADEWYRTVKNDRGSFGRRSMFFQTSPWIAPPASLPAPLPAPAPASNQVAARRPEEVARVVGANFAQVPPVLLRMLAEGMLDVGEDVCKEMVRNLFPRD
ncbi:hypothetical protein HDU85_004031 [Gaertneriomyces sp. JEL0708]|nr:hypothetical protein HDU85_004031 [Gaertneriomyces sp. JEL0708]